MISKLRLEAEAPTLAEVVEDIEKAAKIAKPSSDLFIHDEHYERTDGPMFRGRRVYARGPKPSSRAPMMTSSISGTGTSSGLGWVQISDRGNQASAVPAKEK